MRRLSRVLGSGRKECKLQATLSNVNGLRILASAQHGNFANKQKDIIMFTTGFEGLTQDKALARLKRQLRARAKRPAKAQRVECIGGPFHHMAILMTMDSTLRFTASGLTGYYSRVEQDIQNSRIFGRVDRHNRAFWVAS
jgi:hypothetical protein